jgi:Spy/CpxP family protein refolding chaperone
MMAWWKFARQNEHDGSCGGGGGGGDEARAGCGEGPGWRGRHRGRHGHDGPEAFAHGPGHGHGHEGPEGDGAFGVRRPLRFLSFKLDLAETQVTELAAVLNDLKTERAQAAVDLRRSTSAIADAITGEALDAGKLKDATGERVKSAERLRDAVASAITRIHAILTPEQRTRFAYLIRTGVLSV